MREPVLESAQRNEKLVALLNARLADAIDLMLMTRIAHWNLGDSALPGTDGLFDRIHDDVVEHVDLLAERAVQLGGEADGRLARVASVSQLGPYPSSCTDIGAHLAALADVLERFGQLLKLSAEEAGQLGDSNTAEILGGVRRDLDDHLWFVRGRHTALPTGATTVEVQVPERGNG
ncbi:MAG: ferritin-like domain-containing protein [Candidatus Krumholzibacteriia bacterium]